MTLLPGALDGMTALEREAAMSLDAHGLSTADSEYRWHAKRKWRFDFAWQMEMVALEVEGGTYSGGRHTTGWGFHQDAEKYNEAAIAGWIVIRATAAHIKNGDHLRWVRQALVSRGWRP